LLKTHGVKIQKEGITMKTKKTAEGLCVSIQKMKTNYVSSKLSKANKLTNR